LLKLLLPVVVLGGLGAVFGALLGVAAKIFKVETDERAEVVLELLPGANCGGCGLAGCAAMTEALLNGTAEIGMCAALKQENAARIAELLGKKLVKNEAKVAHVFCSGTCEQAAKKGTYTGIYDCVSAAQCGGGDKACMYGCMGYGSCVAACAFHAISVCDGVAVVDNSNCVGCGACVTACPRELIELVPVEAKTFINCRSHDKGSAMKDICKIGCIGCGLCAKHCPEDVIRVSKHLATISYTMCTNCNACIENCPKHVIAHVE